MNRKTALEKILDEEMHEDEMNIVKKRSDDERRTKRTNSFSCRMEENIAEQRMADERRDEFTKILSRNLFIMCG